MAYQSVEQLFDLLALIRSLGDQVHQVKLSEPAEIQLQDLIRQPFRGQRLTEGAADEQGQNADAYWQMRLLDVPQGVGGPQQRDGACVSTWRLPTRSLITCAATTPGRVWPATIWCRSRRMARRRGPVVMPRCPLCRRRWARFTRLWLGVRPATVLARTDALSADADLLTALDAAIHLPSPVTGWDY